MQTRGLTAEFFRLDGTNGSWAASFGVGGRKRIMTDAKIRSARMLLNQGSRDRGTKEVVPADWCRRLLVRK